MPSRARLRDEGGFTLVELLVTMLILVVGVMGAVTLIDGANARTAVNAQREAANALAREVLEDARAVPYAKLTPGGAVAELQAVSGLADTDPATLAWTVERRNVTYTLSAIVCSADDGKDGFGSHVGGNFCAGASGTADRNPDDYKRLTVKVGWKRPSGSSRQVEQSAVISNEANGAGPDLSFVAPSAGTTDITDPSVKSIYFAVETAVPAAAVKFLVDGATAATDTPSGTSASFNWVIDGPGVHLPDGTYVISAAAYDDAGRAGPTRSRTIRLNRDLPLAPTGFKGGWNALRNIVDLEWNRNSEPDVIGYRVYRTDSGGTQPVAGCQYVHEPARTECVDLSPSSDASAVYTVVALDEDPFSGNPREGDAAAPVTATRSTDQPNQPPSLVASVSGSDLLLDWELPPSAAPPYAGDTVAFFRIYRGGTAIANRHGVRSPGTLTSFKDGNEAAGGHQYWITAVDENYSESNPVGPVSAP